MGDDEFPVDENPTDTSGWSQPTLGPTGLETHNDDSEVLWRPDGSVSTYTPSGVSDTDPDDQLAMAPDMYAGPDWQSQIDTSDPYEE